MNNKTNKGYVVLAFGGSVNTIVSKLAAQAHNEHIEIIELQRRAEIDEMNKQVNSGVINAVEAMKTLAEAYTQVIAKPKQLHSWNKKQMRDKPFK